MDLCVVTKHKSKFSFCAQKYRRTNGECFFLRHPTFRRILFLSTPRKEIEMKHFSGDRQLLDIVVVKGIVHKYNLDFISFACPHRWFLRPETSDVSKR